MARIRFGGEWYQIGSDENAEQMIAGIHEAQRRNVSTTFTVRADGGLTTTLLWTPGVPVAFETDGSPAIR